MPDSADTEADGGGITSERLVADECPNRPGRGHEWYRRTSDRVSFCRDCAAALAWIVWKLSARHKPTGVIRTTVDDGPGGGDA